MNHTPRSLLFHHNHSHGPISSSISQFTNAKRLLSSFITSSFQRFQHLFRRTQESQNQELKDQKKEEVIQSNVEEYVPYSTRSKASVQQHREQINPQSASSGIINNLEEYPHRRIDAYTQVYTYENSYQSMRHLFCYSQNQVIPQNLSSSDEMGQPQNSLDAKDQAQERCMHKGMYGSKKIKKQTELNITSEEQRQAQNVQNSHQSSNEVSTGIARKQLAEAQQKKLIQQMKNQAEQSYQKMKREPTKSKAIREIKEARKINREIRARQEEAQKRFELYLTDRNRRIKDKLAIHSTNQLKLEFTLKKQLQAVGLQKLQKLKNQLKYNNSQKNSLHKKQELIKEPQAITKQQPQKSLPGLTLIKTDKLPIPLASAVPRQSNTPKVIRSQVISSHKKTQSKVQTSSKAQICKPATNQQPPNYEPKKLIAAQEASFVNKSFEPLASFKKGQTNKNIPLQRFKNIMNKEKQDVTKLQAENKTATVQKPLTDSKLLQVPQKPKNPFKKNEQTKTNQLPQASIQLPSQQIASLQASPQKKNPFLSSSPSARITLDDLIKKKPQLSIFENVDSAHPTPPPYPSAAAQVFRQTSSTHDFHFRSNHQQQMNIQGQIQQPFINNNYIVNNSLYMNTQTYHQPISQNYHTPSFSMNSAEAYQAQAGYNPGMFADQATSRSLFQSSPAVQQGGLFGAAQQNTSQNSRGNVRGLQGTSRHRKNNRNNRIF